MLGTILRGVWRLIIFVLGAALIWVAVFKLVPYADSRIPTFAAIFAVYILVAYVGIPFLVRLFRLVIRPDHIPLYATTPDGWPSDPVNLAIVAPNKKSLQRAMKSAGWYEADKNTLKNAFYEGLALLFNTSYPTAPVSRLMLFNRSHDIAFQIPTNDRMSPRTRHHVRFWRLDEPAIAHNDHKHFSFWTKQLKKFIQPKRHIWIGAATEDIRPFDIRWRSGQLTHGVSHDANRERDFIIKTLQEAKEIKKLHTTTPNEEYRFRGQSFRTIYVTDGSLKVIELR